MLNSNIENSGPTGEFPDGKIREDDDGELAIAIAANKKDGIVIMYFGKPTTWIGLKPTDVYAIAYLLVEKAKEIEND